jgi:hypothetical protein
MATPPRTAETVTEEIQREREELARAVTNLRSGIHEATNVKRILRTKWPHITAAVAFTAGVIVAAQLLRRGKKEPVVLARIGRLAIIERDD